LCPKKFYNTGLCPQFQLSNFIAFKIEDSLNTDSKHGFQNIFISFPPGVNVIKPLFFIAIGGVKNKLDHLILASFSAL
jgi:hypothetical protein